MSLALKKPAAFGPNTVLPTLRRELEFSTADVDAAGSSGAIINDPLRHKFFRLSLGAVHMLEHWHLGTVGQVAVAVSCDVEEIEDFVEFLVTSRLVENPIGGTASLLGEYERGKKSLGESALHNYLFFRIPLFNPTVLLDFAMPLARFLASRTVVWFIALTGVLGLYFVFRQWDKFFNTFVDFFSFEGLSFYALTLAGLKICHELGHGFVARHFNCKVPIMGVAFMLMAPMLYTETTDVWRLQNKRQRMLVDAAGVLVELALAAIALFLWAFLPDGPWRSAAYFVAITAWVMSLLVNLSPFMRFDGYHLFADALGMFNLGPRAFALGSWQLRQTLFATREEPPEQFAPMLRRGLIAFAFGTWVYRLLLFLGIAYTVYIMFPKVIGIGLALVEILFFIAIPIWREMKEWKTMGLRQLFSTRRSFVTLGVVITIAILSALPLSRSITIPAVLLPAQEAWLYPPEAARIETISVKSGDRVDAGQVIMTMSSPDISQEWKLAEFRYALVLAKLNRIAADKKNRAEYVVLKQELQTIFDEIAGLRKRITALEVRAGVGGIVSGVSQGLKPGLWLGRENKILHIRSTEGAVVAGLVNERDSGRLDANSTGTFIAESGMGSVVVAKMSSIGMPGGKGIEFTYLSSNFGGAIAVAPSANSKSESVTGVLPVRFVVDGEAPRAAQRGTLTAKAQPTSILAIAFGRIVSVFLRESGF